MKLLKKIKYPLTIIIVIIIIILCILLKEKLNTKKYENIETNDDLKLESDITVKEEKEEKCTVDIKGAVQKPNVYTLDCDKTVNDVIKLSGGLNKNADTSIINLAKKISNEMVIIVYTEEEVKNSNVVKTVIKTIDKECVCPNIQNDSCINNEINETINNKNEEQSLININSATKEQLLTIPGIGESKANAIIAYREQNGSFKKIEDIKNVSGIGNKLYDEIKVYITT